ncbi:MAG TPA: radical SAM protein [Vicinamibacterales bacterium]|nr:radical SAM protein [Vicinamibacterales bacterium]HPW20179.1 radical SAM protein [Vicinamibacterales bacterium]
MLGRRVLLFNPPLVNGVAFTRQGRCQEREEVLGTTKPPYSLALIAALLRDRGFGVRLVDQTAERLSTEDLIARLNREGFAPTLLVFCSATPTASADAFEAGKLKQAFGAPLVSFGPHASAAPQAAMAHAPQVDAMAVGEPEDAILQLAALESFDQAERVDSLTIRRGGTVIAHRAQGAYGGFAAMPCPAWDLLPLDRYRLPLENARYLIVESSRGCPYSCDFCVAPIIQGHKFRERDAVALVDEIEQGKRRFGINHFYLWGDTVTLNAKSFSRFCDELIARNLGVRWFGNGRADNLTNPEFVAKLRQSGCWMLSLGIESESDDVRREMMKKLEREKIRLAIRNLREAGIKSFAFFIFGYPGDTPESIERTARFAREIDPDFANFYPAVPYPGTELYEKCKREGMLVTEDWSRLEYSFYVLRSNRLDEPVVLRAIRRATRRFYLRPSWMARHVVDLLKIVRSSGPLVWQAAVRVVRGAPDPAPAAPAVAAHPPAESSAPVHRVEIVRPAPRADRPPRD